MTKLNAAETSYRFAVTSPHFGRESSVGTRWAAEIRARSSAKATDVWCDFDRASSLICGNKMPTRCNRGFYYRSYCLLNMFRAPLCPSSGAQEYYTVVAVCGISCCGFQVAGLVWSWGLCVRFAGCCSILKLITVFFSHSLIPPSFMTGYPSYLLTYYLKIFNLIIN